MKITLLLITAGLFIQAASAQNNTAKTARELIKKKPVSNTRELQLGVFIGPNISGALVHYPDYQVSGGRPGPGLELGGFADVPLQNKLYSFRTGLGYSLERASQIVEGDRSSVHVSFIKVPLDIIYHSDFLEDRLFFGAGPFLAYCLGGKYNWEDTRVQKIAFGDDQSDFGRTYKRLDVGLNLQGGYQLNERIVLGAHIDVGLLNMVHTMEDPDAKKASLHSLNFAVTAGYVFKHH